MNQILHLHLISILILATITSINSQNIKCNASSYYNNTINDCINCKNSNLYLFNNTCVGKCEESQRIISEINVCYSCPKATDFYYRETCVERCPSNTIVDLINVLCRECKWNNTYFNEGSCIDKCSPNYRVDEEMGQCVNCKTSNNYLYNNTCVGVCPAGSSYYDYFYNLCVECKHQGKVVHSDGTCGDYCLNPNEGLDNDLNCMNCVENNMFIYNGNCLAGKCGIGTNKTVEGVCQTCKNKNPSMFYLKNGNEVSCVRNCGVLPTEFLSNFCINNWQEYSERLGSTCKNGKAELLNSSPNNIICHCNPGFYGFSCLTNQTTFNNKTVIYRFFNFTEGVRTDKGFTLKNSPYFDQFSFDLNLITSNYSEFALEPNEPNYLTFLEEFIQSYYSSPEISHYFNIKDEKLFLQLYNVLFGKKAYRLWAKYSNYSELVNSTMNIASFADSLIQNYETFLTRLSLLAARVYSDQTLQNNLTGIYGSNTANNKFYLIYFSANKYNFKYLQKKSIENYQAHFSVDNHFPFDYEYLFVTTMWLIDMSFYYNNTLMRSYYYNIAVYDKNMTKQNPLTPINIYFPLKDSRLFTFAKPLDYYFNMTLRGINPFNKDDPYFTQICYRSPYDNKFDHTPRPERIDNYFLNITVDCKATMINAGNVDSQCTFLGFENLKEINGPAPYAVCSCVNINSNYYYYITFEKFDSILSGLPSTIFQLWSCFDIGFDMTTMIDNPGLIFVMLLAVLEITAIIIYFIFVEMYYLQQFKLIRKHDMDCVAYLLGDDEEVKKLLQFEESFISNLVEQTKLVEHHGQRRKSILIIPKKQTVYEIQCKNMEFCFQNSGYSDFYHFSYERCIKLDEKRTLWEYFIDYIYDYNIISICFIKFSYFVPGSYRILNLFLYLICHVFFNTAYLSPEQENIDFFGMALDTVRLLLILFYFI